MGHWKTVWWRCFPQVHVSRDDIELSPCRRNCDPRNVSHPEAASRFFKNSSLKWNKKDNAFWQCVFPPQRSWRNQMADWGHAAPLKARLVLCLMAASPSGGQDPVPLKQLSGSPAGDGAVHPRDAPSAWLEVCTATHPHVYLRPLLLSFTRFPTPSSTPSFSQCDRAFALLEQSPK